MPIPLRAEEFAARARQIVATTQGSEAHRAFDQLANDQLRSLGFSEGVEVFEEAQRTWHAQGAPT